MLPLLTLFLFSILMVVYVYAGYPFIVLLLGAIRKRRVNKGECEPLVTILIAAYNEAESIEATIKNKLELDYPKWKREILVISDGSTDGTDEIVARYEREGVSLLRQLPRAGKTSALNLGVRHANGEILVFSDANSQYAPDALRKLAANFYDPMVGYVTGKMIYTDDEGTAIGDGCSAYMKYENFIRRHETLVGSIVGVDGGIDAVRKKLYQPMNHDQLPDFVLPLKVVEQGYRVVYEPAAILKESALKKTGDEYRMRVRVSLRALWAMRDMKKLLFPGGNGLFSWQLWSHKLLRYLCFLFLALAYLTNLALYQQHFFFKFFFWGQSLVYLGGSISPLVDRWSGKRSILFFFHYFLILNIASAHAFFKFLSGRKQVLWTPRKG